MLSRKILSACLLTAAFFPPLMTHAAGKPTVVKVKIDPFSLIRINDQVNYMVAATYSDGSTVQRWQVADCQNKKGKQLYWEVLNDKGLTGSRFYGKSYLRYAPAQEDSAAPADVITHACNLVKTEPVWEKIHPVSATGRTDLIDVAHIEFIGKVLSVRLAYDYAEVTTEPPYDAPLDFKIEHYLYNCETHHSAVIAAMNIGPEGYITDSLMGNDLLRRKKDFPVDSDMTKRFEELCSLPAGTPYKALGKFTPASHKKNSSSLTAMMPQLRDNPAQWMAAHPLTPEMAQMTGALIKPWAVPRFKQLRYTEVRDNSKITVQMDVQPDGYIRKLEDYGIWQVQRLMMGNLLQIKYGMSISTQPQLIQHLKTDLRFPLVAGQHFRATWQLSDVDDQKTEKSVLECKVSEGGEASRLASVLKGRYLQVDCEQSQKGQPRIRMKEGWLKDYNVMLPLSDQLGSKPEAAVKLENVTLVN